MLYLRVDDTTRPEYRARGSAPLRPVASKPDMVMEAYYQVPGDIMDDPEALNAWARKAIAIARANPSKTKNRAAREAKLARVPRKSVGAKAATPTRKAARAETSRSSRKIAGAKRKQRG
jgi:hypothetical protein